jgi:AcrR family transcriptional regulator
MAAAPRSSKPRRIGSRGVPRAVREPQILEVAGRVFAARGYHAASMDEIAAAADVTKPLVYSYFGSKEGLYVAYIERSGRDLLGRLRRAADPSAPPRERLEAGIVEFLGFVEERRDGWRVLYSQAAARGGPLAEEVASLRAAIAAMIGRLLSEAVPARDGVAHAVVGAGESLANWWLANPEVPREQVARLLVDLGTRGLP